MKKQKPPACLPLLRTYRIAVNNEVVQFHST